VPVLEAKLAFVLDDAVAISTPLPARTVTELG
jgi:hypothetical protein